MEFQFEERSIIAMKGPPFTRKTAFASLIAASLKCPGLSVDDVLDVLCPDYFQTSPSSNSISTPPSSPQPQDLAFQIICQMANTYLSTRISDNVVIDSPFSCRSHLDQLLHLAAELGRIRLIIVGCKPKNMYAWQTTFEESEREGDCPTQKWYKAKNWPDVEKAIQEDYDETSDVYKASKLVLDPLLDDVKKV